MNRRPRKKFARTVDLDEIVAKAAGEALSTLMRRALQPGIDRRVRAEVDMYRTFGFTDAEIRSLIQRNWGAVDLAATAVDRSASRESEARGWLEGSAPEEHTVVLLDLARAGDERTFKELASLVGVAAEDVDALWVGTRARLGLQTSAHVDR
jgi:hypothetical protein